MFETKKSIGKMIASSLHVDQLIINDSIGF